MKVFNSLANSNLLLSKYIYLSNFGRNYSHNDSHEAKTHHYFTQLRQQIHSTWGDYM
jgi:hypothetical protein